jgi:hypothetical protein
MKIDAKAGFLVPVLAGLIVIAGVTTVNYYSARRGERAALQARQTIAAWPQSSRLLADVMLERYGAPDADTPEWLAWYDRSPWKRVVVHCLPSESPLEQAVYYRVPEAAEDALRVFGNGLSFSVADRELSAKSDGEELNFLAINLAHDVIEGRSTAVEAQEMFAKTARQAASGKTSRYMDRLLFAPGGPFSSWSWSERGY